MTVRRIEGPAGVLSLHEVGVGGLPVIFLHSLAGNAGQWARQRALMGRDRRAVALDLRGHGGSSPPRDGDYSIPAMARDVAAVTEALGLERAVLVGHSFGGLVALEFAGLRPERVAGLLLADPSGDARQVPREQVEPFFAALRGDAYEATITDYWRSILKDAAPGVAERVLEDLAATPKATVLGCWEALMPHDPVPALRRYAGPALSVITPINDAAWSLHKLVEGLPTRRIEGTSHWLQLDAPETFDEILQEFLADLD
ncbi:MAG TPA: alpha/beta hydrolase [Gemmatimonadota bacterium]|jgi:pimeloyl-ACP methyl ester carboxylesterase